MDKQLQSSEIMAGFAERTGLLDTSWLPGRYLWTDAFAVCNYVEIFRRSGDRHWLDTALKLVNQVHRVLGRHRPDDQRTGWISGLDEQLGEQHPTRGGLRIGKPMNERKPGTPFDEREEWDRDGQYYHYLTQWMHALDQVAQASGEQQYHRWAMELAKAVHAGFCYPLPASFGGKRLYWKMSIDLSRPLVLSMGQHDALDGLITYLQLQAGFTEFADASAATNLAAEIAELSAMCEGSSWQTSDALGIGGLLSLAGRLAQLIVRSGLHRPRLLASLLTDAEASLEAWVGTNSLTGPAAHRLAFRELGLSIGLHSIEIMQGLIERHPESFKDLPQLDSRLSGLARFVSIRESIDEFWLRPVSQRSATWMAHREINSVMLATSLCPDGYLLLDGRQAQPTDPSVQSSPSHRIVPS